MTTRPTGERQLQQNPADEETGWTYHDVPGEWVRRAKAEARPVVARCGYVFHPLTPPSFKTSAAPGGYAVAVPLEKCRVCVDLDPQGFGRQAEPVQVW